MLLFLSELHYVTYVTINIIVCAGTKAGIGLDALAPVQAAMGDPLKTKTITLTCGKLTTGVTVKPWSGIFVLRNLKSPETYFQAAFRVQSPWEITNDQGKKEIVKPVCYVFDFALNRALRQIADYSMRLSVDSNESPEKKADDFIGFMPVLAYSGAGMREVRAQDILDIAMAGTSATLLAKRWESALLVNVDNDTLKKLMENLQAMEALESIEAFRGLNQDLEIIINRSEALKERKKSGERQSQKERKEVSEEEKDLKSKRKIIQDKLKKLAGRIPIFMYLTDRREESLKEVITDLEPKLFKKVTGLTIQDFKLLCSIGVFNSSVMNQSVFLFRRYEDSSLTYTGINKHNGETVGGWDTVLKRQEYEALFNAQQATMAVKSSSKTVSPPQVSKKSPAKAPPHSVKKVSAQSKPVEKPKTTVKNDAVDTDLLFRVGETVTHGKFGVGTVTDAYIDRGFEYVKVCFKDGEKAFLAEIMLQNGLISRGCQNG